MLSGLVKIFQYISCYCLSEWKATSVPDEILFQYISCYCLSPCVRSPPASFLNFNTSHVTVYRLGRYSWKPKKWYFNTSHVTVYRKLTVYFLHHNHFNTSHVTVYRVLIFIYTGFRLKFQYISCYCLSLLEDSFLQSTVISIHLMLLFINYIHNVFVHIWWFQYISCYCLSF